MSTNKELQAKIRKLESALRKSDKKLQDKKAQLSALRKHLRTTKKGIREIKKSRQGWKNKYQTKRLEAKRLSNRVIGKDKPKGHQYDLVLIKLCVYLRVFCCCSYDSVVKVLHNLVIVGILELGRIPCKNTIQNWVAKLGLYGLQNPDKEWVSQEMIFIVDESIRIGTQKQLLVLCTPFTKQKNKPLNFEEVCVLYFGGRKSWTGEDVAQVLSNLKDKHHFKVRALLSDEDPKLKKASRIMELPHLADISHAIATCMRKTFKQDVDYKAFTKLLSQLKLKGVNQSMTYLLPPPQGAKARFMNVSRPIRWMLKLLNNFSFLSKLHQNFFKEVKEHEIIVKDMERCIMWGNYLMKRFKRDGLTIEGLSTIINWVDLANKKYGEGRTGTFFRLIAIYLNDYKQFMMKNEAAVVPISSDIIESLFGKYKAIASKNKLAGTTAMNLQIPVECMSQEYIENDTKIALESISMTNLKEWIEKHSAVNEIVMRRKFFKRRA